MLCECEHVGVRMSAKGRVCVCECEHVGVRMSVKGRVCV